MKAVKVLGLAVIFGLMTMALSWSKDLKVAYVDLAKVFDNYPQTKDFDVVLQKEGEGFQKQRDAMISKVRDEQSKLDLMNDAEKAKMQAQIEKDKNDVVTFDKEKRTALAKRRDDKVREILGEIQKAVAGIAQRDGYTMILNDRVLVYGDPTMNITDEVMKNLNETTK